MKNIVDKYFNFLKKKKGASENTLVSYRRDLNAFLAYQEESGADFKNASGATILD
ncbi:MAG: site-specific integrase, partial [Clostridia bacterium]|nr:site-specific integrase [Clostridia bacterium]